MSTPVPYLRLSGFYFFYFALLGAMVPYWTLYLDALGYGVREIGQLTAVILVTRIIAPNLWGWVADRTGRRTQVIRWGTFLAFVSFLGVFIDTRFAFLALVLAVHNFFWNAVLAQFEVVTLSHLVGRSAHYSRIRVWGSIGFIVAVAALGAVFDAIDIKTLPIFMSLILASVWITSLSVSERGEGRRAMGEGPGIADTLRQPLVWGYLLACFLLQLSHGPYYTFFSLYLEQHGYSRTAIGQLWSLGVVAEVVLFVFMHRIMPAIGIRNLMLVSLLLTVLRWCLIAAFPDALPLLLFAQCLHAASFGSFHAIAVEMMRRLFAPRHAGQGQAIYSALVYGVGGVLGALLAGDLWERWGAEVMFQCAAASALLGFGIAWWRVRGAVLDAPE